MSRRLLIALAVGVAGLGLASTASAYWSATAAGTGAGATGGLGQVTGVATSVTGTVAAGAFDVTWEPVAVPAGVSPTYVVERHAGTRAATVCTTTATGCSLAGIPDGSATYRVIATLNAWSGPAGAFTAPVVVLSAGPVITSHPSAETVAKKPSFIFSEPPYDSFRCRLDGGAPATCPGSIAYPALAPGTHTFEVRAVDAYGTPTQPSTWTWIIDP
jgi:hypothetical protein